MPEIASSPWVGGAGGAWEMKKSRSGLVRDRVFTNRSLGNIGH